MRHLSKVQDRRHQWQHQATPRGDRERYQRQQPARLSAERDRTTQALKAAQARLPPREAPLHRPVSRPKVEVVLVSLHLF